MMQLNMKSAGLILFLSTLCGTTPSHQVALVQGYTPSSPKKCNSCTTTRRSVFGIIASSGLIASTLPANAFDGSGSSAYSGYNAASKAEAKKAWKARVAADVRDFNALGEAIAKGETEGNAWINFFILQQRRAADPVGRTYAALADFRGLPTPDPKVFEGGDGFLLANTFTKSGKPPDNTPAVKSYNKLYKTFDAIAAAGKKGDAKKARAEWEKTKDLWSQYLVDVEMPGDLNDPLYK
jgi:hypothetical protein